MRESPRNTDGLGGWGDAGMGLGVYTAAEAAWLAGLRGGEAQLVPHHEIDTYRADGWSVRPLDCHHGAHSALAVREDSAA